MKDKVAINMNVTKNKKIGIIAEFNPLHNGHSFLINEAKKLSNEIIIALSSNIVQRGEFSIISSTKRAIASIHEGATLVLEIPPIFSLSSAKFYAKGAINILKHLNCDTIIFGSEIKNTEIFNNLIKIENSSLFNEIKNNYIKQGFSYKKAVLKACAEIDQNCLKVFENPNSTLAFEYIKLCKEYNLNYKIIKRTNEYHSLEFENNYISSASAIRHNLNDEKISLHLSKYVNLNDLKNINDEFYKLLRSKLAINNFNNIYNVFEGEDNLILKNIINCTNLNDFLNQTSNKKYTKSRIRRTVMSMFFDINKTDADHMLNKIDYVRVLAIKNSYKNILNNKNIITKYKDLINLNLLNSPQFILQNKIDTIFSVLRNEKVKYNNMEVIKD